MQINPEKFKNKYRTKSTRLQNWNYASAGWYYITICTKNKENYFGKIKDQKLILNEIGKIAEKFWSEIPKHFQNVRLDEFIIMPNHIHGIIVIDDVEDDVVVETLQCNVSTMKEGKNKFYSKISPKPRSLSTIIRSFKSICTKTINNNFKIKNNNQKINFAWQPKFYDHIIRNEESLNKIREYIFQNPFNWEKDENFK